MISEALAIAIKHHQGGRLQTAEDIYRQILAVEPNHADATHLLGLIAHQMGRHEIAVEYIGRAIALNGTMAEFHDNLGGAYRALRRMPEAAAYCRRAVELKPDDAAAHYNLGLVLNDQGKLAEAVACYRRALELRPDYAEAHNNLGNAFKNQEKLADAIACYYRALELRPDYAEAYSNLGAALRGEGKLEEAIACYRRALQLKPDNAEAHSNLGLAFVDQRRLEEAAACYRRALELKPDLAEAHFNRSFLWLLSGNFAQGWPEYECRWQAHRFAQPLWGGEALAGKTILLHAEQGFGDTIQFVRYAPIVKQHGGTVILACQKPLLALLEGCAGIDQLIAQGNALPAFDVHAPLMSLPGILKTTLDTIPAAVPYLSAPAALTEYWREKLRDVRGYRIGINWRGRPGQGSWLARDLPLQQFAILAEIPGVCLISLQKGTGREELQQARERFPVVDLGDEVDQASGAFVDTAAIMKNLDLVITSDTSVPNLAGSLAIPVWVALTLAHDWRWLLDRSDSPWYPTMRLFRQREQGNWQGVFDDIRRALCERLQSLRTDY